MRFACLPLLLFASIALGQTTDVCEPQPSAPGNTIKSQIAAVCTLPPTAPVITVVVLCESAGPHSAASSSAGTRPMKACKTVITREEFDALAGALHPHMSA